MVDGLEPVTEVFMERYNLTAEEGVIWSRTVQSTWFNLQIDFLIDGPSDQLDDTIIGLWKYSDVQIVYKINEDLFLTPEFVNYVNGIIDEKDLL